MDSLSLPLYADQGWIGSDIPRESVNHTPRRPTTETSLPSHFRRCLRAELSEFHAVQSNTRTPRPNWAVANGAANAANAAEASD